MSDQSSSNPVRYASLDFLGQPQYRVGSDGSVWCLRGGEWRQKQVSHAKVAKAAHGKRVAVVGLYKAGKQVTYVMARVVLETFVGPCPPGAQACYKDGDRTNVRLDNLCWSGGSDENDEPGVTYKSLDFLGYPNYRIGDDVSVWSLRQGKWERKEITVVAKGALKGRRVVQLWASNKGKVHLMHRLMLLAFVGPCPDGMEACHNNGDPSDNRLDNLRWDTKQSNQADRIEHGTSVEGREGNTWKLRGKVEDLLDYYREGHSMEVVAAKFGVTFATVSYHVRKAKISRGSKR